MPARLRETGYAYSFDGEHYHGGGATRREALAMAREDSEGERRIIHTARIVPFVAPDVDADHVIDQVREEAYDVAGEFADDWLVRIDPDALASLTARLSAVFRVWMAEHDHEPTFWTVTDEQAHRAGDHLPRAAAVEPDGEDDVLKDNT